MPAINVGVQTGAGVNGVEGICGEGVEVDSSLGGDRNRACCFQAAILLLLLNMCVCVWSRMGDNGENVPHGIQDDEVRYAARESGIDLH